MGEITVLVDNYVEKELPIKGEHGFSVLLEIEDKRYLVDTGQSDLIVQNAAYLKKDLRNLDGIFLSHGHYDHTGGLKSVLLLQEKPIKVFGHPDIFKDRYNIKDKKCHYIGLPYKKQELEAMGADFKLYTDFIQIDKNIYMTGEIPRTVSFELPDENLIIYDKSVHKKIDELKDDISIVINTNRGLIVIMGCAHSGPVNIINWVQKKLKRDVFAVIGGTHLATASEERLQKTLDKFRLLNIRHVLLSHCTGFRGLSYMEGLGGIFSRFTVGQSFSFELD